jgi:hypothetical protein
MTVIFRRREVAILFRILLSDLGAADIDPDFEHCTPSPAPQPAGRLAV